MALFKKYAAVKIGKLSFKAEVADNILKKAKGLMFRKNLPKNQGMLFMFPNEDYHQFWMIFTKIPLDIIWINSKKKIVHIENNVQPSLINFNTYGPKEKAKYALEINANLTKKHGIKIGDKVEF